MSRARVAWTHAERAQEHREFTGGCPPTVINEEPVSREASVPNGVLVIKDATALDQQASSPKIIIVSFPAFSHIITLARVLFDEFDGKRDVR